MLMLRRLLVFALLLSLSGSEALAAGSTSYANESISARRLGMGGTSISQVDEPANMFLNAASLAFMKGSNLQIGNTLIIPNKVHYTPQAAGSSEQTMRVMPVNVPHFFATTNVLDGKLGAGVSMTVPYGLETHWKGDSPLKYVATNSMMKVLVVTPAIAYQVTPEFSIGIGADYYNIPDVSQEKKLNVAGTNYSSLSSARGLAALADPDGDAKLSGNGDAWSYNVGMLYRPNKTHSFGFNYRRRAYVGVKGKTNLDNMSNEMAAVFGGSSYETNANTELGFPDIYALGYSYYPTDKLTLAADVQWTAWNTVRASPITYPDETNATRLALLTAGDPTPKGWKAVPSFGLGANYQLTDKLEVRGGTYIHRHTVPDSGYTPTLIDANKYVLTYGFGYALTEALGMDFAYNTIFYQQRTISNDVGAAAGATDNGTYSGLMHLMSISFKLKFK